ncbi:MAG: hypothetical protein Q9228_005224 [Teloschistes exilis]
MFDARGSFNGNGFFVPSYLRNSRYIERVQAAHEAKLAAQREASQTHNTGSGALSSRSSSVSLPKLAPSHRGMTYEVIEHQPAEVHDGWSPLPSKWAETDKNQVIAISDDGLEMYFAGGPKLHDHEGAATRTDHPMPAQGGIYYYEVTILAKGKDPLVGIGFSGPKVSLEKLPGWEPESWGWHGDDGNTFCGQTIGKKYGPTFTTGDVVGCGINFMTGCAFFTKNGNHQGNANYWLSQDVLCLTDTGTAFRELKDINVYPSVGMKRANAQVTVNFGQRPFVYDIDDLIRYDKRERAAINEEIKSTDSSHGDEGAFLKELVAQLFDHDGYIETAKAFQQEVRAESRALQMGTEASSVSTPAEEDLDTSNRQQIRAAIMDGDIDKALKRTSAYYPKVLRDHSHVYFRLRCQKFVEMFRQTAEIWDSSSPTKSAKFFNDASSANIETDHLEMDVDEPKAGAEDWDRMEMEEADTSVKYQELLEDTIQYGQVLKEEFRHDPNTAEAFKEIFSLFIYEDPRKSPHAHLLDRASRLPVAEELNSAILVSLGKRSSAAIELLYQQTELLVDMIGEEGGAGAFINLRNDFLR